MKLVWNVHLRNNETHFYFLYCVTLATETYEISVLVTSKPVQGKTDTWENTGRIIGKDFWGALSLPQIIKHFN